MKTTIQISLALLGFFLLSPLSAVSQNSQNTSPTYDVHQVYPYISVSKTQLTKASTLYDLKNNKNNIHLEYQPNWVDRYISVEIQVCQDGQIKKATAKNDTLTREQKHLLANADTGKEIQVHIHYWPKNTLVNNEPKTIDFSFSLDPENAATFSDGMEALNQFLEENVINKISANSFKEYEMTAIKFTINKTGNIEQPDIFGAEYQSENLANINELLLATIQKMPRWEPASYGDGTVTEQSYVLTVGSAESCVMPLLNIGRD